MAALNRELCNFVALAIVYIAITLFVCDVCVRRVFRYDEISQNFCASHQSMKNLFSLSLSLLLFLSAVPFNGDDVFVVSLCAPSTREGETKDAIGCGRRIWGTELKEIL